MFRIRYHASKIHGDIVNPGNSRINECPDTRSNSLTSRSNRPEYGESGLRRSELTRFHVIRTITIIHQKRKIYDTIPKI